MVADFDDDRPAADGVRRIFDLARLRHELRTFYLLYFSILGLFLAATVVFLLLSRPTYTATALVGPSDESDDPFSLSGGLGGGGGIEKIAKHLHVGGALGQNGDDKFDEYTSLLTSDRLAAVLAGRDHILPEIFADQWDAANKRWLPPNGFAQQTLNWLRRLLNRPTKLAPDQDDLAKFLAKKLTVDPSLETSFVTVTFNFGSPAEAERILGLILAEADNIIREDKRRDASARIAYLNRELEHLFTGDQKPEMIEILSQQEQEMMMIESNHRYASNLIDPPHASRRPTSPVPTIDVALAFAFSFLAWIGAVRFAPPEGRWYSMLQKFARPRMRTRRSPFGEGAVVGANAAVVTRR